MLFVPLCIWIVPYLSSVIPNLRKSNIMVYLRIISFVINITSLNSCCVLYDLCYIQNYDVFLNILEMISYHPFPLGFILDSLLLFLNRIILCLFNFLLQRYRINCVVLSVFLHGCLPTKYIYLFSLKRIWLIISMKETHNINIVLN